MSKKCKKLLVLLFINRNLLLTTSQTLFLHLNYQRSLSSWSLLSRKESHKINNHHNKQVNHLIHKEGDKF